MARPRKENKEKGEYATTTEVAAAFGVTSETIRNWVDRGLLNNAVKKGTRYLIPRSEVIRLARERYGD